MKPVVEIIRLETGPQGTFGAMRIQKQLFCLTLELPDLSNRPNISCIPAGQYLCERTDSPRFGETFEVQDVPNRSHILFHPGNVIRDTEGCILVGQTIGKLRGDRAVLNSGMTFNHFLSRFANSESFHLTITEQY